MFRENDFLLTGGAGVGLDLGSATLIAEGLYNLGLLDINNDEEHTAARHRGPVLRIGVDFGLWCAGLLAPRNVKSRLHNGNRS